MNFQELMNDPWLSTTVSIGINLFSSLIEKVGNGIISKKKVEKTINKSIKLAGQCVGIYKFYPNILEDISVKLRVALFKDLKGKTIDEIVINEINISLKEHDSENIRMQSELSSMFIYFFMQNIRNDKTTNDLLNSNFIKSSYNEIAKVTNSIGNIEDELERLDEAIEKLMFLSPIIDDEVYINFIDACEKDANLLNRNINIFDDVINYYISELSNSWKENCIHELNIMKNKNVNYKILIDSVLDEISDSHSYDIIKNKIIEISHEFNKKEVENLFEIVGQSYKKAIIVSGEPGAGKTEFLSNAAKKMHKENENKIYVIPIDYIIFQECSTTPKIVKKMLEKVNFVLNTNFQSFSDFNRYCETICQIKIIFAIDDCHKCEYKEKKFLYKLINIIKIYSGYDCIAWMLFVNEFDMYIFDGDKIENFIFKYVLQKRNENFEDCTLFNYDFNITKFNSKFDIGTKVLKSYGLNNVNILDTNENLNEISFHKINNPFIAHMVGKTCDDITDIILKSYYFEFASSVVNLLVKKLLYECKKENINCKLDILLDYVIESKNICLSENDLNNIVDEDFIINLRMVNLIKFIKKREETSFFSHVFAQSNNIYELYFDIFWAHQIFTMVDMTKFCINTEETKMTLDRLLKIDRYKEEICAFILYYFDKSKNLEGIKIWVDELFNRKMLYIVFTNARLLNSLSYNCVFKYIEEKMYDLSQRDAYTLLYSLRFINLAIKLKYKIICKYANYFDLYEMGINFKDTFNFITSSHSNIKNFLSNIEELWSCKIKRLNLLMGSVCAHCYFQILMGSGDSKQALIYLNKYIVDKNQQLIDMYNDNADRSNLFWDEFFKETLYISFKRMSLNTVFDILYSDNLFFNDGNKRISLMYRTNFARAAGDIFSSYDRNFFSDEAKKYKTEYISLANKMFNKGSISLRKFVFHLITNSLKNDRDPNEKLVPELVDILKRIKETKNMSDFVTQYKTFFDRIYE